MEDNTKPIGKDIRETTSKPPTIDKEKEEVGETDRRIMAAKKKYEAKMLDANRKAKDFPMTN